MHCLRTRGSNVFNGSFDTKNISESQRPSMTQLTKLYKLTNLLFIITVFNFKYAGIGSEVSRFNYVHNCSIQNCYPARNSLTPSLVPQARFR